MRVACDIDQDVAQGAVDQPRRHVRVNFGIVTICFFLTAQLAELRNFSERDFQLIHLIVARFIHARGLAGGPDEHAAEQIAQAGVVVPSAQQAREQFWLTQEGAVSRREAAHHEMVAAAGAGVFAIGHEFFGAHSGFKCCVVQKLSVIDQFAPCADGLNVHLHHTRIGRDLQHLEPWIARRRIAL